MSPEKNGHGCIYSRGVQIFEISITLKTLFVPNEIKSFEKTVFHQYSSSSSQYYSLDRLKSRSGIITF